MSVRSVLKMGDPRLYRQAQPVTEFATSALRALLQDMQDTMAALNGAGLAAPQIGEDWQVVIFGVERTLRYPDAESVPYTVLINPILTPLGDSMVEDWEGCLSIPGMRGRVLRFEYLRYQGFDQNGHPIEREVSGFHARVVQHECDHLQGILYPMRITDLRKFGYNDTLFPDQPPMDE